MFGAKLSWCQIVRCQIVLVPNCPGAKLSTFIILVPNCPFLFSCCQTVCFIILVPNCPVPNCPTINFSQRVKCKADQISHFCLLVDIKERPRMCKKKSEKRKQSVKQRGGARRNTKTQTQKSRKAKSQEHSCKMS